MFNKGPLVGSAASSVPSISSSSLILKHNNSLLRVDNELQARTESFNSLTLERINFIYGNGTTALTYLTLCISCWPPSVWCKAVGLRHLMAASFVVSFLLIHISVFNSFLWYKIRRVANSVSIQTNAAPKRWRSSFPVNQCTLLWRFQWGEETHDNLCTTLGPQHL